MNAPAADGRVPTIPLTLQVVVSGASVLALEILGTRTLGPFYGVSLFLWSALITVTLAALSVGYALGGRFADRTPTLGRLGGVVTAAGVWVMLVPLIEHPVLRATEALGLRAAVLTTALLLFGPPLTLLGMVSPYAIRLRASSLQHVGRTAGDLYAISTVAGVAAALAMGFFLIPSLGVARLTYSVGLLLVGSGCAALAAGGRGSRRLGGAALVVLAAGALGMTWLPRVAADPGSGLVAVRQSPYAEIRVVDMRGARHLLIDGGVHSIIDKETLRSWHDYTVATELLGLLYEQPGSMLLVGLGGGSIAKTFAAHGWSVQAVEIDPVVGEMAHDYFGLTDEECTTTFRDGRRFLRDTRERFDLIVIDAFGSSSIPFHLATTEAFALAASRLAPGGILAMNVETLGWHDPLLAALAASLKPHFAHVLAFPTSEPPNAIGNVIVAASDRAMTMDEYEKLPRPFELLDQPHRHWWAVAMTHAWDNRFAPDTDGVAALTDDLNPLDLWSERVNRTARKNLHDYFGNGTSW